MVVVSIENLSQLPLPPWVVAQYPEVAFVGINADLLSEADLNKWGREKMAALSRRRLFAAGRVAAELALRKLGHGLGRPLGRDSDGLAEWPIGYCGSISHSGNQAWAVVAKSSDVELIGIDYEAVVLSRNFDGIAKRILTSSELQRLSEIADGGQLPQFTVAIFSAKEALYKAFFPTIRRSMPFSAAEWIDWNEGRAQLRLRLTRDWWPEGGYTIDRELDLSCLLSADECLSILVRRR